ncbi:MAG: hypothetical protein HYV96_15015 [Opitutae bacterium]|nr:hypothetical protein [Opitutae bacterium]
MSESAPRPGSPTRWRALLLALAAFLAPVVPSDACTIFLLTDGQQALFCNNEDWENKPICLWFVPARQQSRISQKRYGCAFVGFGSRWGQGGMNTEGLAYDWVAGYQVAWRRAPEMKSVSGNPAERMLEQCATVEEAIAFFQTHWEPSFSYARILIADRTGASVVIGAADGRLDVQRSTASRGCGFGGAILDTALAHDPSPQLANAAAILDTTRQSGRYATRYSNIFDLKTGTIFVSTDRLHFARLDLAAELERGRHSYDLRTLAKPIELRSDAPEPARASTAASTLNLSPASNKQSS